MESDDFEWDDEKARSNRVKHHVDFETAKKAFADVNAIEELDTLSEPHEERSILTGMADRKIIVVVYAKRKVAPHFGQRRHEA